MKALAIMALALAIAAGATTAASAAGPEAVGRQQSLARERMQDVERRLLELADLIEPQDPARAAALRRALTVSRQEFVVANMANIESLLQGGNYGAAAQTEEQVLEALKQLGDMLGQEAQPADLETRHPGAISSVTQQPPTISRRSSTSVERPARAR